jgi:sec-independent protein translocase protein TatB
MDIFGIGPTELVFIILIALILLGPKEMEKTGRTIGRFLRNMTQSEGWRAFKDTSREIRNLPNRLMREANIEDIQKNVGKKDEEESGSIKGFGSWSGPSAAKPKPEPPQSKPQPAEASENQIAPPAATRQQENQSEKEPKSKTDKDPDNDA